jgi:hypothetical protein
MRADLKERLMEALTVSYGPLRYAPLEQVADVVDLVEEIVDNDNDRRENDRLTEALRQRPGGASNA